jgi:hypothetical protein
VKGWIERAFFDPQQFVRGGLDVQDDSVPMQFSGLAKRLENKKVQSALKIRLRHLCKPHVPDGNP